MYNDAEHSVYLTRTQSLL